MRQEEALAILKTGRNVFLTGEPGSGKTHTVNSYIRYLEDHGLSVAVTASTGIAATHLGGVTIHSWSGIGINNQLSRRDLDLLRTRRGLAARVQKVSTLVIDEISMLDAQVLSAVDNALRFLREDNRPFGGVQVVFVGDFFQLPPVSRENSTPRFAFESDSWAEAKPVVCYLSEQHRQMDNQFTQLLNSIRSGNNSSEDYELLLERQVHPQIDESVTRLYSHNLNVDTLNHQKLEALKGDAEIYPMSSSGNKNLVEQLQKGCLSPQTLLLKPGASVMFTKNDFESGVVNGTLGTVTGFKDNLPIVETNQGQVIKVSPADWAIKDDDRTLASISQIPLRLAWAITVHKSQGMTLDAAVIDLSKAFAYGQGYVAISRVRELSGLYLLGINERALQVHPQIVEIDLEFRKLSQQAVLTLGRLSPEELSTKHRQFIISAGGTVEKNKAQPKASTYSQTYQLFVQGKSIEEIARTRNLKSETIINHLERLRTNNQLTKKEVERVVPAKLIKALPQIHHAFLTAEDAKLSPIYEAFKGRYSYEELRLARLVL